MALRRKRRAAREDDPDEDLMELYSQGDARAFEILLRRHERRIFHFIFRFVHDRELANDLLQETFLRVVKGAQSYSPKARFTTWLYTIARNLSIDALRKARHRRHLSLDQPRGDEADGPTLMDRVPGKSAEGYGRTDSTEIRVRVEHAVEQLSDEQREVFLMRECMAMQFKEIAEVVGVSENTIKSRMRYALENLRLALADYAAELPGAVDPVPARSRA
ncbi:MAG: RNA polymerase sigma factor [Myxococcales bacterium]|nr:RNA polymerase sigma factor [Myxococcales bacterium]